MSPRGSLRSSFRSSAWRRAASPPADFNTLLEKVLGSLNKMVATWCGSSRAWRRCLARSLAASTASKALFVRIKVRWAVTAATT